LATTLLSRVLYVIAVETRAKAQQRGLRKNKETTSEHGRPPERKDGNNGILP
jgi:hypothetical protein